MLTNKLSNRTSVYGIWKKYATSVLKDSPVVSVEEGKLRGTVLTLFDGSPYYSFKGIPYAQPPIGSLRFKAPLPVQPWQGIHEAINHGPVCPQFDFTVRKNETKGAFIPGSEDCLYLNVYTKTLQADAKLPVMVYIHGGGFMSGSGNADVYGPEFLLQHDVVLVTFNYRLETFGFLCLDTADVPGNAGMKDQVAVLRWVHNNIVKFGGDPNNVTLFGESAGGMSVTHHILSPMSKGLFHKAIAQSGVSIMDSAMVKNPLYSALAAAKFLGKEADNPHELLNFFQSVPVKKLTDRLNQRTVTSEEIYRDLPLNFLPTVEKRFQNVECFLDEHPLETVPKNNINKVPLIVGYNSLEGTISLTFQLKILDVLNKYPGKTLPSEIALNVSETKLHDFGERLKKFYVGDKDFDKSNIKELCDKGSDVIISYNVNRFAHLYSRSYEHIYMYRFNYDTGLNITKNNYPQWKHLKGAGHADELFYLFNNELYTDVYQKEDRMKTLVYQITKLWTDFSKTSNPTPDNSLGVKWHPYSTQHKEYLDLDDTLTMKRYPDKERVEFWNSLYRDAGLPCIS